ncbi:hypothetical protein PROFUN_05758 [Planoprotostelium fungivorum]|uniref:Transmembrane protein n=1 Tax=Planoprotostelium fungivorum TaxID=1890364 RepID=A0A2P6NPV9_9EUKA|nr:hypothetical protein PROFUN_05758 [Planoprotostelium fungivorum]
MLCVSALTLFESCRLGVMNFARIPLNSIVIVRDVSGISLVSQSGSIELNSMARNNTFTSAVIIFGVLSGGVTNMKNVTIVSAETAPPSAQMDVNTNVLKLNNINGGSTSTFPVTLNNVGGTETRFSIMVSFSNNNSARLVFYNIAFASPIPSCIYPQQRTNHQQRRPQRRKPPHHQCYPDSHLCLPMLKSGRIVEIPRWYYGFKAVGEDSLDSMEAETLLRSSDRFYVRRPNSFERGVLWDIRKRHRNREDRSRSMNDKILSIAAIACLSIGILFSIIAIAAPGWGHYSIGSFDVNIGWKKTYVCSDMGCSSGDNTDSPQSAGNAAVGLSIIAILAFVTSLGFRIFFLAAPFATKTVVTVIIERHVAIRWVNIALAASAAFWEALAWICWIGIIRNSQGGDVVIAGAGYSFGLAIVSMFLAIAAAVISFFDRSESGAAAAAGAAAGAASSSTATPEPSAPTA